MNINEHIKKETLNEFAGSEKKKTVVLDNDKVYMLKLSDPTREKERKEALSYINNAISEHVGCEIAKSLGFEVQNTILGEYTTQDGKTRLACLCEDLRNNEIMHEVDMIKKSNEFLENASEPSKERVTFENTEKIINENLAIPQEEKGKIINFYYDLFILDTLIGNTDRHNGNWALLSNRDTREYSRISPVYDCGSSLLPLIADQEIMQFNLRKSFSNICSVIRDEKGKYINYEDYIKNTSNPKVDAALTRMISKIDLNKVVDIIDNTSYISEDRKFLYKELVFDRYQKVLIPGLERVLPIEKKGYNVEKDVLYSVYQKNIRKISKSPGFTKQQINIEGTELCIMRVSKRYALILNDKNECTDLLPIRSNNNSIKDCLTVLEKNKVDIKALLKDAYKTKEQEKSCPVASVSNVNNNNVGDDNIESGEYDYDL